MHLETSHSAIAWRGYLAISMLGLFACGGDDPAGPDRGATQLAFLTEPVGVEAGAAMAVVVEVQDASGQRVGDAELPVTLSLGQSPDGAALSGTETVRSTAGVASFSGLSLDSAAAGYTLTAQADNLSGAESAPFQVMPGQPASLAVTPTPARLNAIGDTLQLEATVRDRLGNAVADVEVTWNSADPDVATVDEAGRVVSMAEGEVMITAEAGGVDGDMALKVEQVAATVTVTPPADTLAEGETAELVAVAVDSNGVGMTDAEIVWASEVPAVAAVTSIGSGTAVVEARGPGPTLIIAIFDGQTGTAEIEVLRKIAFVSNRDGNYEIYVMNADGSGKNRLTNQRGRDNDPAWSPDGSRIAFVSRRDGNNEIYVMNSDGSGPTNLTNHSANDDYPAWSPDASRIAFKSLRDGNSDIYVMNADGTGQTRLTNNSAFDLEPAWSPDGRRIAFRRDRDIYVMNADGSAKTRLTNNSALDASPTWSPDGDRMAFTSSRGGNKDIYVMNSDGSDETRLTNGGFHHSPDWSPDGSKMAFRFKPTRDGNEDIYVMDVDGSGRIRLTNHPTKDWKPAWRPDPQP